jgi:hypothetical protein
MRVGIEQQHLKAGNRGPFAKPLMQALAELPEDFRRGAANPNKYRRPRARLAGQKLKWRSR